MPRKYITQHIGGKGYTSPLHKFIDFTGRTYGTMTRKEIDAVGDLKQYKQWKKLQRIKRMLNKQKQIKEGNQQSNLDVGQFSKKYKHIDPTHISRKKLIATLMAQGYSPEQQAITATKQTKFGRAKPKVGKRSYIATKPGFAKFREITFDPNKKGRTKTIRLLKKRKEYKGKEVARLYSSYENEYNNSIFEAEPMTYDEKADRTKPENKVNKLVSINKDLKSKEFKVKKTMTGKGISDTNVVEIDPKQITELPKK